MSAPFDQSFATLPMKQPYKSPCGLDYPAPIALFTTPAPNGVVNFAQFSDKGGLVPTTDVHNCVVRIAPPLLLSDAQIDKSLEVFESVLKRGMK